MSKTTALERAQAKIEALKSLEPDQRAELLKLANIGQAAQARAIGRAFRVFEQALDASDLVLQGAGKNAKKLMRPNWNARLIAARALWEVLGAVAQKKSVNAGPSGNVQVNVTLPGYASGESITQASMAPAIDVVDVVPEETTAVTRYSAAYAARVGRTERSDVQRASRSGDGQTTE